MSWAYLVSLPRKGDIGRKNIDVLISGVV